MKKYFVILVLMACLMLTSCVSFSFSAILRESLPEDDLSGGIQITYPGSLISYTSAKELVDAADAVFVAKVTGCSAESSSDMSGVLHSGVNEADTTKVVAQLSGSLYELDIQTVYKGNVEGKTHLQTSVVVMSSGTTNGGSIVIQNAGSSITSSSITNSFGATLQEGKTYLFLVKDSGHETQFDMLNSTQTAFSLDTPMQADKSAGGISPQNIIMEFGEDKWEEFYQKWAENAYS